MKVLFAVHDEKVSLSIVKKYQKEYKEIISYKNVYYFNAILKELQRDKTYDRVVIDEELEEFTSTSYEEKDKFIFNKLDNITDEASNGKDMPIILICSERRTKSEDILVKLFSIGIYNAIIGNDRSTDEVCRLINQPRSKKEAKLYYRIDVEDAKYDPESEDDVSEEEMQHILSYFKKLGKNEEKYVECFKKIVSQYNKKQMKIIIAILPLHVRSVLEELSPEYQKLVAISGGSVSNRVPRSYAKANATSEKLLNATQNTKKSNKPIVVPSSLDKNVIKKVTIRKPTAIKPPAIEDVDEIEEDDDEDIIEELETKATPKRRGRPPKSNVEKEVEPKMKTEKSAKTKENIENIEEPAKKRRGRPPKKAIQEEIEEQEEFTNILPGIEEDDDDDKLLKVKPIDSSLLKESNDDDDKEDYVLPGMFDDEKEDDSSNIDDEDDSYDDEDYDEVEEEQVENADENNVSSAILPGFEDDNEDEFEFFNKKSSTEVEKYNQNYDDYDYTNYNNLLSSNRKVIAFVGTSKNGTSFIVNNVAKVLSDSGIDTAILDATQNKNSYYIYNNNDDQLRTAAANSIQNLIQGNVGGMQVDRNLSVYVEVPGQEETDMKNVGPILENIVKNHSAVLIDCDFNTPYQYFANAQEIYLIQSMDVLTIQPLTAFLKELKNRNILEQRKIRIIVNKAMRLKGVTPKQIVGGMSNYNNPEMSIMTELFDRNQIVPIEIPFDTEVYARYLEDLAECRISINKYPKEFQNILKKLSSVIYPLLPAKKSKEKPQRGYQYSNGFSNSVNNTLNNMKKNY